MILSLISRAQWCIQAKRHAFPDEQRKSKEHEINQCPLTTSSSETQAQNVRCDDETEGPPAPKRLRSSVCGPLRIGEDSKRPNRARGKLFLLNTQSAWCSFKRHPVLIEDGELRDRLTQLVESTSALTDPFTNDIMYHHACWQKYVNHTKLKSDDAMHLQNVCLSEARSLFFRHVDSIIFANRNIRSLQSLLADYKRIVSDYG